MTRTGYRRLAPFTVAIGAGLVLVAPTLFPLLPILRDAGLSPVIAAAVIFATSITLALGACLAIEWIRVRRSKRPT